MSAPASPDPDGRRRAVLAAAAVLALLAVAGLGVLLLRDDETDVATLRPTPSPQPSVTPTPSPPPPPSAEPSAGPTPSPTPMTWDVAEAFVTPAGATAAAGQDWAPSDFSADPGPLLDPCGDGEVPLPDRVAAADEGALAAPGEIGDSELLQEVVRYQDEQDAAAALSSYLQRVQACPRFEYEEPEGDAQELSVVTDASGPDRLLVRQRYCNPACTDLYTTYALVARAGSGVTVLRYAIAEDGDPADDARALLDVAADQIAAAVG